MSDMMKKMDNSAGWGIIKIRWKAGLLILQNNSSHTDTQSTHLSTCVTHQPSCTHLLSHTYVTHYHTTKLSFTAHDEKHTLHPYRLISIHPQVKNFSWIWCIRIDIKTAFVHFKCKWFGIKSIVKIKLSITEQCFLKNNFHKKERKKNWNHIHTQTLTHWTHLNNIQSYFIMIH